jgi:hypothetical protein
MSHMAGGCRAYLVHRSACRCCRRTRWELLPRQARAERLQQLGREGPAPHCPPMRRSSSLVGGLGGRCHPCPRTRCSPCARRCLTRCRPCRTRCRPCRTRRRCCCHRSYQSDVKNCRSRRQQHCSWRRRPMTAALQCRQRQRQRQEHTRRATQRLSTQEKDITRHKARLAVPATAAAAGGPPVARRFCADDVPPRTRPSHRWTTRGALAPTTRLVSP